MTKSFVSEDAHLIDPLAIDWNRQSSRGLLLPGGDKPRQIVVARELPRKVQGFLLNRGGVKFDFEGPSQSELESIDLRNYPNGFPCMVTMDAEGSVKAEQVREARDLIAMMKQMRQMGARMQLRVYFSLEPLSDD